MQKLTLDEAEEKYEGERAGNRKLLLRAWTTEEKSLRVRATVIVVKMSSDSF